MRKKRAHRLLVCLGVGNRAVQVVRVNQLEHLLQHCLAALGQVIDVVAVAHDEDEICDLAQRRVLAKRFDERRDVLLRVGTAHREHNGFVRVAQEAPALHTQISKSQQTIHT